MLSEITQKEKDRYCIASLICGILKKKKKVKLIETESRKAVARGWRVGEIGEAGKKGTDFQL